MATPKKSVLVPVNDDRKLNAAPPGLAMKLASPAKPVSMAALNERLEAAAVRRDIELEQKQFRAKELARAKGEVASPRTKRDVDAKLAAAEARRLEALAEVKSKAAASAALRGARAASAAAAARRERGPGAGEVASPRTKQDLDVKLQAAEARRLAALAEVKSKAAASAAPRGAGPRPSATARGSPPTGLRSLCGAHVGGDSGGRARSGSP